MLASNRDTNLKLTGWLIHAAGVVSLICGVIGFQYIVHAFIVAEQHRIIQDTREKEEFLERGSEVRTSHRDLTRRLMELEANAVMMRQRIPDQPREAEFLKQVSQAADEVGLKILNYQRGALVRKPTHSEFEVQLTCDGQYASVCGFLEKLSELSRVTTVQSMNITAGTAESYPFQLTVLLYFGAENAIPAG